MKTSRHRNQSGLVVPAMSILLTLFLIFLGLLIYILIRALIGIHPPPLPNEFAPPPQAVQLTVGTNGLYELPPGVHFHVERSTNMVNWTIIHEFTEIPEGEFQFVDPAPPPSCGFYRIIYVTE